VTVFGGGGEEDLLYVCMCVGRGGMCVCVCVCDGYAFSTYINE